MLDDVLACIVGGKKRGEKGKRTARPVGVIGPPELLLMLGDALAERLGVAECELAFTVRDSIGEVGYVLYIMIAILW
jgi:hypothetical protein